jgi:hypothetical protein
MFIRAACLSIVVTLSSMTIVHADQAECEAAVRALIYPYDENKPTFAQNRFGTIKTTINGTEQNGYSLQTADGSVYFDANRDPVSLSFTTGESYWSPDGGKTWTLVNPNSPEVMKALYDGLRSQADKANNIACEYDVAYEGRTVNHYVADYSIYNTGDAVHVEYWVDPQTGFVWRDLTHTTGSADVMNEVRAEPAPDLELPSKPAN